MAKLEDYLSQETLDKLRGKVSDNSSNSSPQDPSDNEKLELLQNLPQPGTDTNAPISNTPPAPPLDLASLQGPNSSSISTPPSSGTGPLSNPNDYKQALASAPQPETEEESAPPRKSSAPQSSPSDSSDAPSAPMQMPPSLGFSNNTVENLKAAQAEADHRKNLADLGQAAGMIQSGALGLKYHTNAPDVTTQNKFWEEQRKNADQGVANAQALGEKEKDDPASAASTNMRAFAQTLADKAKLNIKFPNNMSYADIEKKFPFLTKMVDVQESGKIRKEMAAQRAQDLALSRSDKKDAKSNADQDKALQSTQQLLESARGNPAAAQAEKDLYSASKAESLANLYGDPNKLSPQQNKLYVSEIAKIATGGVPTQGELHSLDSGAAEGKIAEIWSKISNKPQPANAGEFIKAFQDYAKSLKDDARQVIKDKYGRVIEGRKKQLGDENYKSLQDQYLNRFNSVESPKKTNKQDSKITDYASQHGLDYDSAKNILVNRGYQPVEK